MALFSSMGYDDLADGSTKVVPDAAAACGRHTSAPSVAGRRQGDAVLKSVSQPNRPVHAPVSYVGR